MMRLNEFEKIKISAEASVMDDGAIMEIDDNDWSVMSNTSEDKITMVTCVMNNPSKRLCVIATKV